MRKLSVNRDELVFTDIPKKDNRLASIRRANNQNLPPIVVLEMLENL
jgi:hypothetical protein